MNTLDDFPKKADLIAEAKRLYAYRRNQVQKDRTAVYKVIGEIEAALAKKLAGLTYTPAAVVKYAYDLDRPYDYFSLYVIVQCNPMNFDMVWKKIKPWQGKKTFPLKFPSTTSRQNAIGCMEVIGHSEWDASDGEGPSPIPDANAFAMCFQFVEW